MRFPWWSPLQFNGGKCITIPGRELNSFLHLLITLQGSYNEDIFNTVFIFSMGTPRGRDTDWPHIGRRGGVWTLLVSTVQTARFEILALPQLGGLRQVLFLLLVFKLLSQCDGDIVVKMKYVNGQKIPSKFGNLSRSNSELEFLWHLHFTVSW